MQCFILNFYKDVKKPTIALLGGGGRTGKFVVARLLREQYHLKILLRNPQTFDVSHPLIKPVYGDALDSYSIRTLLQGCAAVISTIGQRKDEPLVAKRSTDNIIKEMEVQGIHRYIVLAGLNVDTPADQKGAQTLAATAWMKANFPLIQTDRQSAYTQLSASDIDWTLVRVPMIEFSEGTGNLKVSRLDCPGISIHAGDIAQFIVEQLDDKDYIRQSPFIAN